MAKTLADFISKSCLLFCWAYDSDGGNISQLNLIAKEKYLLGHITSRVRINGVDVLSNPLLNVDVCLVNPTTVTYTYHPPSNTSLEHTNTTTFTINIPANSHKLHQGFVAGFPVRYPWPPKLVQWGHNFL